MQTNEEIRPSPWGKRWPYFLSFYLLPFLALLDTARRGRYDGHHSWSMTELLLNYGGGFVRRGLEGQIFFVASSVTHIPENYLAMAVSLLAFAAVYAWFYVKGRDAVPQHLLVSAVLLGAPLYGDFVLRKDLLNLCAFLACLTLLGSRRMGLPVKILATNLICVVAILNHEPFAFLALLSLFFILRRLMQVRFPARLTSSILALLCLLPALFAVAVTIHYHGNADTAHRIDASLAPVWHGIKGSPCCSPEPEAALGALMTSTSAALHANAQVLHMFADGVYVPLAWVLTMGFCFLALVSSTGPPGRASSVEADPGQPAQAVSLMDTLVWQLIAIAPLFVIGWDFGRWIFYWTASSAALYVSGLHRVFPTILSRAIGGKKALRLAVRIRSIRFNPYVFFFIAVPGWYWSAHSYLEATPLAFSNYVVRLGWHGVKHILGIG